MVNKPKLTAAEKQRRYREKRRLDPEREASFKAKHKIRNDRRKKISDMTEREQRSQRKLWKTYDKKRKQKKAALLLLPPTPPDQDTPFTSPRSNKRRGRKTVLRNRSKCVRDNVKLKKKIEDLKLQLNKSNIRMERFKKRAQRARKENQKRVLETPDNELTPISKAQKILGSPFRKLKRGQAIKNKAVRTLVFHDSLVKSLKDGYKINKKKEHRRVLSTVLMTKYIRQYRLQNKLGVALGLSCRKRIVQNIHIKESKVKFEIESFYLSDDVSKMTAGIKETVTRKKVKKQKRYLVASMKHLYNKFLESRPLACKPKISYSTFVRYRPFYVCKPTEANRDTCLCKQHANITFKIKKLKQLKLVDDDNPHELSKSITCNKSLAKCMYGHCLKCKDKKLDIEIADPNEIVTWNKWDVVKVTKERTKEGKKVQQEVKIAAKISVTKSIKELEEEVQKDMKQFKVHIFNIKNQNKAYKTLKEQLTNRDVLLHIDFSENYACKLAEEVQTYHFGASRQQATLHTGVFIVGVAEKQVVPFCSISESRDHSPAAIWAHLSPILKYIHHLNPEVKNVHFFSDGPSTQYRQKKNFFLFTTKVFEFGFKSATWSFFEASHGKGAPDGVGGALKRGANALVAHGTDIPDAKVLFEVLKEASTVKLFYVNQKDIDDVEKAIPKKLKRIAGTHKIHQIATHGIGKFHHRPLSCFCAGNDWTKGKLCKCHFIHKTYTFPKECMPRLCYDDIYSDSDSEDSFVPFIDTTDEEDIDLEELASANDPNIDLPVLEQPTVHNVHKGVYVLVKFLGGTRKKTTHQYVGVCQSDLDEEFGEVRVMYLNVVGENASLFKINENDVSDIDFDQIVGVLPDPDIKLKGNRVFYKFPSSVDVFERG